MKKFAVILLVSLFLCVAVKAEKTDFRNCDFIIYNKCVSCSTPYAFEVGFEHNCTKVCPNRTILTEGSGYYSRMFCHLKQCPLDKPFRAHDGSCYEDEKHIPSWNNNYSGFYDMFDDDGIVETSSILVNEGQCPQDKPLMYDERCFSCMESKNLQISEDECNKCPNRKYIYSQQWKHGECVLPCPQDKPLKRWDGKCFSCNEAKTISVETWCNFDIDCNVCPNRTIIHAAGGNSPSVPNCPADKPLMDAHGICYSCDTPQYVDVRWNQGTCARICPNRYLYNVNDSCILRGMKFE